MNTPDGFRAVFFTDDDAEHVYQGIVRKGAETWSGGLMPFVTVETMADIVEEYHETWPTCEQAHEAGITWYDLVPMLGDYYEVVVYEHPARGTAACYDDAGYPVDANAWGTLNLLDDDAYNATHPGPKEWIDLGSIGLVWHEVSLDEATERVYEAALGGYMAEDYGEKAWRRVAKFLLKQGHSEHEAMAIMRSKHARWADDSQGRGIGKKTNSAAFKRYYEKMATRGFDWLKEGREMAAGTPDLAYYR